MNAPRLTHRDTVVRERMDDPDCDLATLRRTYQQFRVLNRLLAGWRRIYRRQLRPLLSTEKPTTLLDVGCGGGDVARFLASWADRDGLRLSVTAIDPDERAYAFALAQPSVPGVVFRRASSAELVAERATFDVVVSNHVLHHLDTGELDGLLADSERLARRLVVHSDLARSRLAYLAYAVVSRPFAGRSFVHVDGLLSIRRSFRAAELGARADNVGTGWRVLRAFPARLLLVRASAASPSAARRSGPLGSGPLGSGPLGSGPLGSGPLGSGQVGSGWVGSGWVKPGWVKPGPGRSGTMRDMRPAILFTAAAASYAANCALGAAVASRWVDTSRVQWVHHALYTCTATLAGGAASSLLWSRSRAGWWLLPAAVPLVLIPRVSARTRRHPQIALSAAPFFAAAVIRAWR